MLRSIFRATVCCCALVALPTYASVVTVQNATAVTSPVSLIAGASDWTHYGAFDNSSPSNTQIPETQDNAPGTGFSNLSIVAADFLRAWDNTSPGYSAFTWTGGTPHAAGDSNSWGYAAGNNGILPANSGVQFTRTVNPGDTSLVVYAIAYDAEGGALPVQMSASLADGANGSSTSVLPTQLESDHYDGAYQIDVSNTTALPETMTVQFLMTQSTTTFSNVGIYGASVVPEPTMLGIVGMGVAALLAKRRR